jgi:light-regulated signal transduction histidine kinase (bacteriophytochrome)
MTKPSAEPRNTDRDARVAELEAELQQCRDQMRSFSYSVSHDLRAPLRAIEGFGRILLEDYATKLDEEGQRFLQNVLQNAQTMSTLIDDLLTFHRLGERSVTPTKVNMTQLVNEVVAAVPKADKQPQPEIKLQELPDVTADAALLRIAWEQLISNGIKFSKSQPRPLLEFGSKTQDGEHTYWLRDNGIGFDMQYADKLFNIFQKLQRDPEYSGNGIGLALVKRAVEKNRGRVWAEARPNQGATFYMALPRHS